VKIRHFLLLAGSAAAWLACRSANEKATTPTPPLSTSSAAPPSSPSAHLVLDQMDQRTPLPLLPMMAHHQKQNMRDHLVAVQEIIAALSVKDFDAVRVSAGRIGYSERMGQMCEHMGSGAPGFTPLSLKFHHTADTIGEAAKNGDADGILRALGNTLAVCTSCHQTFKQHPVSQAEWSALKEQHGHD
jgi:hypothetical protein